MKTLLYLLDRYPLHNLDRHFHLQMADKFQPHSLSKMMMHLHRYKYRLDSQGMLLKMCFPLMDYMCPEHS